MWRVAVKLRHLSAGSLGLRRRDDRLVYHGAELIRVPFGRDQETVLKKAQRLAHGDQGGISTDGFTLVGADRLQCRMKAITYLII